MAYPLEIGNLEYIRNILEIVNKHQKYEMQYKGLSLEELWFLILDPTFCI